MAALGSRGNAQAIFLGLFAGSKKPADARGIDCYGFLRENTLARRDGRVKVLGAEMWGCRKDDVIKIQVEKLLEASKPTKVLSLGIL